VQILLSARPRPRAFDPHSGLVTLLAGPYYCAISMSDKISGYGAIYTTQGYQMNKCKFDWHPHIYIAMLRARKVNRQCM
jgi:hypothetical protein